MLSSHDPEGHGVGFHILRVKGLVRSEQLGFLVNQVNRFYFSQLLDQPLTLSYHCLHIHNSTNSLNSMTGEWIRAFYRKIYLYMAQQIKRANKTVSQRLLIKPGPDCSDVCWPVIYGKQLLRYYLLALIISLSNKLSFF